MATVVSLTAVCAEHNLTKVVVCVIRKLGDKVDSSCSDTTILRRVGEVYPTW